MRNLVIFILLLAGTHLSVAFSESRSSELQGLKVSGYVFHDKTGTGSFDHINDIPLGGIAVSNGREVTVTDNNGYYELPVSDNAVIFVIKPRNWMVPLDDNQLPEFYHVQSISGLTGTRYKGLSPTGPIPSSVDFPLYPSIEPDRFNVLVFGDTQPRNEQEIYYLAGDLISELAPFSDAAFGVTLGDIVFDDLDLFDPLARVIGTVGIPWRYVLGNHDIDFTASNNDDARGAWYRFFGPSYYSFAYGPAHFIVLDNVRWIIEGEKRYYRTGLGEDQMEFMRNEISRLDNEQLVVVLTHIPYEGSTPWQFEPEQQEFYELLAGHPNSVSLVAHTHRHYHHFIGSEEGFPGDRPHHMISVGTVCGSWWTGAPDEYGIPHAMMSDGTPTSYSLLQIDGNDYKLKLKAARRPADFQMHIHMPEVIDASESANMTVTANIFNALPSATVKMKFGENGQWIEMERVRRTDPVRVAVAERERQVGDVPWRNLGNPQVSEHIWEAAPGYRIEPGAHILYVKAVDDWWEYEGRKIIFVR